MTTATTNEITPLQLGHITLTSRLVVGTGKYADYDTMEQSLAASGCSAVTVAVRVPPTVISTVSAALKYTPVFVSPVFVIRFFQTLLDVSKQEMLYESPDLGEIFLSKLETLEAIG